MFEKLMLGVMTLFMTCEAFAVQLSPQEALSRMNNTQSQSKGIVSTNSAVQLAYTSSYKGINTYYVFNKDTNDGYIILSADDCMPAVLGVVDRGSFDINNIPDNMKWWLSQYDTSISSYASKGKKYVSSATKKDIAPLLANIAYGQGMPYNDLCPEYNGIRAATGCVATAMAQIMRMHKWPERGTGRNEYECRLDIGYNDAGESIYEPITLKTDFSQSIYQWDKMPETYMGLESYEEMQAVARLMYDCGVAANMAYGLYGSGALESGAYNALIKHFNYDRDALLVSRYYYKDAEWEDLMYENLSKGLPIFYTGSEQDTGASHAFVCDGYQAKGNLFHFNWGWDGWDNGYFLITSNGGNEKLFPFSNSQNAILNIKPASEPFDENKEVEFPWTVSHPYDIRISDCYSDDNTSKIESISRSDLDNRARYSNPIMLFSKPFFARCNNYSDRQYAIGVKAKSEKYEYVTTIYEHEFSIASYFDVIYLFNYNIPKNGKYALSLVYKDLTAGDTEWKEMQYLPGIEKPVLEITGAEEGFYILDKPDLIYDGKVVANRLLPVNPNTNDLTIRAKFKTLNESDEKTIECNISAYNGGDSNIYETKTVTIPALSNDGTYTADFTFSPEKLIPGMIFFIEFRESDTMIPCLTDADLSFEVIEAPTGIETITQNKKDKASEVIYNIYGQKVKSMNKGGIYISGGKKFIAK